MYEYLLNHNYISYNKKPCKDGLYKQKELSVQRARCIANKCDSLTIELQEQLSQLQQENKNVRTINHAQHKKILELEQDKEELIKWLENEINDPWFSNIDYREQGLKQVLSKLKESAK